jgi:hypothetical protein
MDSTTRYFLTYSGRALPLQLAEELPVAALRNRNTWWRCAMTTTMPPMAASCRRW